MNVKGVDLSKHNGNIKIEDFKKAGYNFAILRGGYTGYGSKRPKAKDQKFEDYYAQAKKIGFPVGCYYYSCATSKQGGINEAEFLYENCLKGKQFEYPIYIDIEEERWQKNNKKGVTDAIIGFCETLENKGYYVGIYSSVYWFNTYIDSARIERYSKWVAAWRKTAPEFKWNGFKMWQNSDNGKIGNYRFDTNICYYDFPSVIKNRGLNGFKKGTSTKPSNNINSGKKPVKEPATAYFKRYTGNSISLVDALKYIGVNSSFTNRAKIARANGIKIYTGSAKQNTQLLNKLKAGVLIKP